MEKNDEYTVTIEDTGYNGEGIAKINGITVFVKNAIKGELLKIKILKVKSNLAYGKIIEIIKPSEARVESDCETYQKCGGCDLRHVSYGESLKIKENSVKNTINKFFNSTVKINSIIGMENPLYYRNKLQFPVGISNEGEAVMGVFSERTHTIIPTNCCRIQDEKSQEIANSILDFIKTNNIPAYNEKNQTGLIRHIYIRIGKATQEVMVVLVLNNLYLPKEVEFIKFITEKYPIVKTIVKNLNNKNTNVILGERMEIIYGDGYIYDYLGEYKFKISPKSFYQVNPIQTKKLYEKAIQYAELSGNETIFDLYCGIGTIGIFASKNAKNVYGIEIVSQAIQDAKINADINNVKNAEFLVGKVEDVLPKLIKEKHLEPDVVFLDPPRKGCDTVTLDTLLDIKPKKIVYISCNPATLGRDLEYLSNEYNIKELTPFDLFAYTKHCEVISLLELKG